MSSTSLKKNPGVNIPQNSYTQSSPTAARSYSNGNKPGQPSRIKPALHKFSLIPEPVRLVEAPGSFLIDADTVIVADESASPEAELLASRLATATGRPFDIAAPASKPAGSRIEFKIDDSLTKIGDEGYRLRVGVSRVTITARTRAGLFYGLQTLLQLLPPAIFDVAGAEGLSIPCVEIEDYPRFVWRGAMLDVARHFMPVAFVKKFIDLLALHKLNILHLHLNDDQGWRIEIKKYPRLTSVGSTREHTVVGPVYQNPIDENFDHAGEKLDGKPYGGFYTQEEARDLVAYASSRHVTLLPEIDMPGHAQAAIAAYPELGNVEDADLSVSPRWGVHGSIFNVRESTIGFLQDVLAEVIDIFPSPYLHIGGDEAHKQEWVDSPEVQARMKELGLSTVEEMQSYFIKQMDDFVTGFGRRIVGWDEILEGGLARNAVVMSWRGEAGGIEAARSGHDVIMSPSQYVYLDYYQSTDRSTEPQAFPQGCNTLSTVYHYEPIPEGLPEEYHHHVLGTQGQLWSEYMPTESQVEYMAFPRLCAIAEVTWTPADSRDYVDFTERLRRHTARLDMLNVAYRPLQEPDYAPE